MSNLDRAPSLTSLREQASPQPAHQLFTGREVLVGSETRVRRLLPNLGRRLVGAWCFVDHYGPDDIANRPGMQVPPHPHMGLQTVSWLLDGEVHHRDSLGSDALIRPGELGLMTAGHAITHAEYSPVPHPELLHGVQLWVALPAGVRDGAASWEHHTGLPVIEEAGMQVTVMLGSLAGAVSPGTTHTPLVGASVLLDQGALAMLPLEPEFEHAVLVISGAVEVDGELLDVGSMLYLGCGRSELMLRADSASRLMLLGGEPFDEEIVMWWNFVGRSAEEIAAAREEWAAGDRFGVVQDAGAPLAAPPLPPGTLKPGGAIR
ncbi:pirin family protein [Jatrophihabitans sp.]|uniref:pirin family protein n=1 Tax=Jatrophihabitans sp. TaxID=1932789 RepID=UPI0030C66F50|nr:pirin [Jatrophihabitans sp.]